MLTILFFLSNLFMCLSYLCQNFLLLNTIPLTFMLEFQRYMHNLREPLFLFYFMLADSYCNENKLLFTFSSTVIELWMLPK